MMIFDSPSSTSTRLTTVVMILRGLLHTAYSGSGAKVMNIG